ncbi:MAG: hypothetical protein AAF213_08645 [Pseudomonadota bacterium]
MASPGLQRLLDERRDAPAGRVVNLASGPDAAADPALDRARKFVRGFVGTMVDMAGPGTELVGATVYAAGLEVSLRLADGTTGTNQYFEPRALRHLAGQTDPGDVHAAVVLVDGQGVDSPRVESQALSYPGGDTTQTPTVHADIYTALEQVLAAPETQHLAKHHDTLIERMAHAQFDRATRQAQGRAATTPSASAGSGSGPSSGPRSGSSSGPRLH